MSEPTKFVLNEAVPIEENHLYEFKEITGKNPRDSIKNTVDEYVVAFLNVKNGQGGSIYWGIEDKTRKCIGVELDSQQRDEIRKNVNNQLAQITPSLTPNSYKIVFHHVYNENDEVIDCLRIVEVHVDSPRNNNLYFANGIEAFIKTDSGKKKLSGTELVDEIKNRVRNELEEQICNKLEKQMRDEIINARSERSLEEFFEWVEDFRPFLNRWIHHSIPTKKDAKNYFSSLQIIFSSQSFSCNKTLQSGTDHLLKILLTLNENGENYVYQKMFDAHECFSSYLGRKGMTKTSFDLNTREMIWEIQRQFKNFTASSDYTAIENKVLTEDTLLVNFILYLLDYVQKSLQKGQYAEMSTNLTHSFDLLAAREFSMRFGVVFPDPLDLASSEEPE